MSHLFSPLALRGTTFRNRLVLSPMCQYAAENGFVGDWHREHHARLALGGLGGAILEATAVVPEGRITPGCLGIWSEDHIAGLSEIVATYHRHGTAVGIQLAHAGRKASTALPWEGNGPLPQDDPRRWTTKGPSAVAFAEGRPAPEVLTEAEIGDIVAAFGAATRRAMAAGFDFVEIHGAHGYLIHAFLADISNRRIDAYGGSLENRMRLALEVTSAVRAALPEEAPLLFRVSAIDGVAGGTTIEETVSLAKALKAAGVDLVDCSSGGIGGPSGVTGVKPTPGFQVPLAAEVKRGAGIPKIGRAHV